MIAALRLIFISLSCLMFHPSSIAQEPLRIVSAGGSITEILYALGMENSIVATDTSSNYPANTDALPKVGYYRQLNTEGVLKLKPSHVFAINGVGPDAVLQQLESMGVVVHIFAHERSTSGLQQLVTQIGQKVGRKQEAQALNARIQNQLATLPPINTSHKPSFFMSVNERGLMAAGNNTVPDLLFSVLQLDNPFHTFEGFKPVSSEALLASGSNMIFIPQHQTRGMSASQICELPALSMWSKIHGCQLHVVDSLMFLGLTPRLGLAAKHIAQVINAAP
jgi:iron complex transport system substrate-binding protein